MRNPASAGACGCWGARVAGRVLRRPGESLGGQVGTVLRRGIGLPQEASRAQRCRHSLRRNCSHHCGRSLSWGQPSALHTLGLSSSAGTWSDGPDHWSTSWQASAAAQVSATATQSRLRSTPKSASAETPAQVLVQETSSGVPNTSSGPGDPSRPGQLKRSRLAQAAAQHSGITEEQCGPVGVTGSSLGSCGIGGMTQLSAAQSSHSAVTRSIMSPPVRAALDPTHELRTCQSS